PGRPGRVRERAPPRAGRARRCSVPPRPRARPLARARPGRAGSVRPRRGSAPGCPPDRTAAPSASSLTDLSHSVDLAHRIATLRIPWTTERTAVKADPMEVPDGQAEPADDRRAGPRR